MPALDPKSIILQVVDAINLVNTVLSDFELAIEGEVANYSVSRGQFVFFDLKDEKQEARLSCFMMVHQQNIQIENGMRIVVRGRAGLYQKSGQFRISVSKLEAKGEGSLKKAFDLLFAKLEKEGLFAKSRKRLLPQYVKNVGIISSKDAAGFGDFKKIAWERMPGVDYVLANVAVQGQDAEREICKAFEYLNSYYSLDAILLLRGGGSMEDLHAFNSELVARAIVASKAPVVVGVGHEKDVTIADYSADLRASTPSNAAQLLLPTKEEVEQLVQKLTKEGQFRLQRSITSQKEQMRYRINNMRSNLQYKITIQKERVAQVVKSIEALSPERTLERGYSITYFESGVLATYKDSKQQEKLVTRFKDGKIISTINNLL